MPDWITFAWSVACAIVGAVSVAGGVALTFYVAVKVDLALAKKAIADLESANRKHFAMRDGMLEKLSEFREELLSEIHHLREQLTELRGAVSKGGKG